MTTLALPNALHRLGASTKNLTFDASFQALPNNQNSGGTSFGVPADLHFSENVFGCETENEVDDLLKELGIAPHLNCESSVPFGEEDGPNSSIFITTSVGVDTLKQRSDSPFTSESTPAPLASFSTDLKRSISLEQVDFFSVPNPIFNDTVTLLPPTTEGSEVVARKVKEQGQKRKVSNISPEKEFTAEEIQERRHRNRNHAKKSRQRKKEVTMLLHESIEALKQENTKLREHINTIIGHKKAEAVIEEGRERNREDFLAALMNPRNRVLNNSSLAFMRNLRKNLPSDE